MGKKSRGSKQKLQEEVKEDGSSWLMPAFWAIVLLAVSSLAATACAQIAASRKQPRLHSYDIKAVFPHNPNAFTQGLEYEKICSSADKCTDILWESTGMNGESEIRMSNLTDGKLIRKKKLSMQDFGEGLVRSKDRLLQLTWRSNKILSYSVQDLDDVREHHSALQDGWGITHTGGKDSDLIISDGSNRLTIVDHETLETMDSVQVTDDGKPVRFLNELEFIKGEVWANIWQTECIARINYKTGAVRGWIMLHGLLQQLRNANAPQAKQLDVLNGIAWDKEEKRIFVTGKYWPSIFEIQLRPHPGRLRPETLDMARRKCII